VDEAALVSRQEHFIGNKRIDHRRLLSRALFVPFLKGATPDQRKIPAGFRSGLHILLPQ